MIKDKCNGIKFVNPMKNMYFCKKFMERKDRSFKRRLENMALAIPLLLVAMIVVVMWHRSLANALVGLLLAILLVLVLERMLHTEYRFEGDMLVVIRGRFAKRKNIPLNEIIRVVPVKGKLLVTHYLLIEYGAGREQAVQPMNEEAFLNEIKKRQNEDE